MKKSIEDNELAGKIGKLIAKKRMEVGLTQEDVAEAMSLSLENIGRMERGLTLPNVAKFIRLAEVFGCPVDDLLSSSSPRIIDQERVLVNQFNKMSSRDRELLIKFAHVLNEQ